MGLGTVRARAAGARQLVRIGMAAAVCVAASAFAGLPWADASSQGSKHVGAHPPAPRGWLCVRDDGDDTPGCLPPGPRGPRGLRGRRGPAGPRGAVGAVGPVGPVGAVGPQGATGARGIQGIQGIQGPPGAFASGGSDPGGHTVIVLGTKIGPIPFPNGPATGTELTPSVARCPTSGIDQEAYGGGATVITANPNNTSTPPPPTNDVVGLESSYPGLYAGPTEVDPLPLGGKPGAVSQEAANAYEVQAVITDMHSGDNLTVQAYVICGPTH